jgi:hypothetical protein
MQAVPTSVAVRPKDKNIYVGQLTGYPFPVGGANVYRIKPDGTTDVYASGFTNIVDIAWAPNGSLYGLRGQQRHDRRPGRGRQDRQGVRQPGSSASRPQGARRSIAHAPPSRR